MLEVDALHVRSGDFSLREVSLCVGAGEYVGLMGASGAGKTTLLEAICGLRPVVSGEVRIDGEPMTHQPPALRGVGLVPQDIVLFTAMSVAENLSFGLVCRGAVQDEIERRVAEVADRLAITPLLGRRPDSLSGGEARRVAVGRAIAFEPAVLLLDEPLSGLDVGAKEQVSGALQAAAEFSRAAVLHVTHNEQDFAGLAQKIAQIEGGVVTRGGHLAESSERAAVPQPTSASPPTHTKQARSASG